VLSGFATAGAFFLLAGPLHALFARVGGLKGRAPLLAASGDGGVRDAFEMAAALAALWLFAGGAEGDVLVAGGLAAAATARRSTPAALALLLVAATAALRAGSTSMAHVAGTHAVLGPAFLSPARRVAVAAALGTVAALAAGATVVRGRPRGGWTGPLRSTRAAVDALLPVLAAVAAVLVAAGPVGPAPADEPMLWAATHGAAVVGAGVVGAVARRVVPAPRRPALAMVAGGAAVAALVAGFLAR
jgi:hypothetical protein